MALSSLSTLADFHRCYAEWFGEPTTVWRLGHDDLCLFPSRDFDPPYVTYLSAGTSLQKMNAPDRAGVSGRVEFVFYAEREDERYASALMLLMTFPFVDRTWLQMGHTVALAEPIDDAGRLTHVVLLNTLVGGHAAAFGSLRVAGDEVDFLWPVPITAGELALKKERGVDALLDLLAAHRHPWTFGGDRPSYA